VATTAGANNQDFVKSLGATYAFDHNDPDVVDQILKVLKPGDGVLDCIGSAVTQKACAEVVSKIGGGTLAAVLPPAGCEYDNVKIALGKLWRISITSDVHRWYILVNGLDPGLVDLDIGDAVWRQYIPQALAAGKFQAKPDPLVLEGGLERVQDGINILRKGVSAKKVVIEVAKSAWALGDTDSLQPLEAFHSTIQCNENRVILDYHP
jgi:Zn-dependent alcohol dehydrogenase